MNEIQIFNNSEFGQIRTVTIGGEPWFVGKDIANDLGYKNSRQAISTNVDVEDKGVHSVDTPSGKQQMTIINESGLYALIFGSKLPSAKRFKHWVTSEVLPSLRKTGKYSITEERKAIEAPTLSLASILENALAYNRGFVFGVFRAEVDAGLIDMMTVFSMLSSRSRKIVEQELLINGGLE